MSFETISEIKAAAKKFWDVRSDLKTRYNTDFNLFRLKPYNAGKGYYSYTTNAPRVQADKLIAMLCEARLLIRIPSDNLLEEDRKVASSIEKFLYGCLNLNDEHLMLLNQPILRDTFAWFAAVRGGYAFRDFVNKTKDKKTTIEIVPWDLYKTAYSIGDNGTSWATYTRKATREGILEEYPDTKLDKSGLFGLLSKRRDEVEVIDYWDAEKNGVIVESAWAKELEPHGLKKCPVHIVLVGGMPSIISDEVLETEAERGQSIFAASRLLFPILSKTISDRLTIVRRGVKTPLAYKSIDGKKTLDIDIYQVEKSAVIPMEMTDVIEPILKETMPADVDPLIGFIAGELQRGGFSHATFGEISQRISGYALSQLIASLVTVVSPFIQTMERSYTLITNDLMEQFASGGYEPVEVMGKTSKNEPFGYPVREKIKASDLKEDWRPEISLVPTLPKDDAQRYQLANIARMGEPPLRSMRGIREDILQLDDVDLEQQWVDEEWGSNIPLIRLQKSWLSYIKAGDLVNAGHIFREMQKIMAQMQSDLQAQQEAARQLTGLEAESMGMPGAGLPAEGEMGMSPEVYPPEQGGGLPGGISNAVEGGI